MKDKTALITGGATRLGRHFTLALAKAGYNIALHYNSSADSARDLQQEIGALGVQCRIYRECFAPGRDPSPLIDRILEDFSSLEVLINNASAYAAATTATTEQTLLEEQFAVNFFTPFLLTRAFANCGCRGNIVNILDNKIAFQQFQYSAYLLAKKALAEFTSMAALEFAPRIRVNGIAPGVVMPGESRSDAYIHWRIQGIPLQGQGAPENLVNALHYLLNNDFVTGQILYVDGGEGINHTGRNAEDLPADFPGK